MKVLFIIKKNFILILLCMFTIPLLATGPSRIISEIKPLSINDKGEILCKTRFSENRMGAHGFQRIEYGLCVITQDTIIQYKTHQFNPEEFSGKQIEELIKYQEYLDSIYTSVPDKHFFSETKKSISKKYNFVSYNVESYKIDKTYSISEFERYKKVDLQTNPQRALYGAFSTNYSKEQSIFVLYDFGLVVLMNNISAFTEEDIGANFDYYNPWVNKEGKEVNIGFDLYYITGVLFVK